MSCPHEDVIKKFPHSADLRKHRFDVSNYVYFITKRRKKTRSLNLVNPDCAEIFVSTLFWLQSSERIYLLAFVIMPDHIHLILSPRTPYSLAQITKSLFSFSAKKINEQRCEKGPVWETEYYEHTLTHRGKMKECLEYIYLNPVRKNLVENAKDWPYSSNFPKYADKMDWTWYGLTS